MSRVFDGLDQQAQSGLAERLPGVAQVGHERAPRLLRRQARRRDAREAVRARAIERPRVADGLGHARAELVRAARVAGDAALARRPVARGQVDERLRQPVFAQARGQLVRRMLVGEGVLDRLEAVRPRQREALKEGGLREEEIQVRRQSHHGSA